MNKNPEKTATWIAEFQNKIHHRQHIILHGNIHDQFLWRGNYHGINEFLTTYFQHLEFPLIFNYDLVDGFSFINEEMRNQFDRLTQQRLNPSSSLDNPSPSTADLNNPLNPPPRRHPGAVVPQAQHQRIAPEEAFGNLRAAVNQEKIAIASIIDLGDMLTTNAEHYGGEERNALILLKKCTLEAKIIREGNLTGYRHNLIILASELKRVPIWFYQHNPYISLINVTLPEKEARKYFILRFGQEGFYGGKDITNDSELDAIASDFAELTEGFQTMDLEALRHTSFRERIPLSQKQLLPLIDYYKFGEKQEPFEQIQPNKIIEAEKTLSRAVIGQNHAVRAVTDALTSAKVGISMSQVNGHNNKPKGIFFFVGPTGVGKTELAKSLTRMLFGDEKAFARFDMSEYKEEHAAEKLAGSPPGFVGYEEGGQLTNRVKQRPYSILLFDEIEKAHPKVLDKFLQILEDGRLTDGKGETAYFNQTVIIFTSNIGASDLSDSQTGSIIRRGIMSAVQTHGADNFTYEQVSNHFKSEVNWYFTTRIGRAELLNRLGDNIIVFDLLRSKYVLEIGHKFLQLLSESALDKYQLTLTFEPSVDEILIASMQKGDNLMFGGRRIKTILETLVERPLNRWLFKNYPDLTNLKGKSFSVSISANGELNIRILAEVRQ